MKDNRVLEGIQPERVFYYFEELCRIPHGSQNTKKISDYCMEFAKNHGLEAKQDKWNNCIIKKTASKGREKDSCIMLQGHLDMVTEQTLDCGKNMETEGLDLAVEGDYVFAKGTTLGGDDGIAIAYALAVLEAEDISHPPLEALFTVDEEIGMLGAKSVDISDCKAVYVLNLDSEEEGSFLGGCAGGMTVTTKKKINRDKIAGDKIEIQVRGLTGGHSGAEIHKERANANIVLGRILHEFSQYGDLYLESLEGGNKDNAIPINAKAEVVVEEGMALEYIKRCEFFIEAVKAEYSMTDPHMDIEMKPGKGTAWVANLHDTGAILQYLFCVPDGVQNQSTYISGLVETSLNFGIVRMEEDFKAVHSVRSDNPNRKQWVAERLRMLAFAMGGQTYTSGEYPAWTYKVNSPLQQLMTRLYKEMFDKEASVETIHAGLECGYLLQKKPELDIVSFGPDILDIHTTQERMSLSSVKRTYEFLLRILEEIH